MIQGAGMQCVYVNLGVGKAGISPMGMGLAGLASMATVLRTNGPMEPSGILTVSRSLLPLSSDTLLRVFSQWPIAASTQILHSFSSPLPRLPG